MITSKEAGRRLGVSQRTVTDWCKAGKLKAKRVEHPIPHWLIEEPKAQKVKKVSWFG